MSSIQDYLEKEGYTYHENLDAYVKDDTIVSSSDISRCGTVRDIKELLKHWRETALQERAVPGFHRGLNVGLPFRALGMPVRVRVGNLHKKGNL